MIPLVCATFALLGTASLASAATTLINVDFNCNNATTPANGTYSGTGVLGGGTWNGIVANRNISTIPTTALVDSTNAATSVSITVGGGTNFNNAWDIGTGGAGVDASQKALMGDYLYLNGANNSTTITIAGLDTNTTAWTLVLFGANGANSGSNFTIGGVTKTTTDTGTIGATLAGGDGNAASGDEYVTFTGTGNGPISITWTKVGTFSNFNGFQLEQVPEPSAALLGGLGLLGLLRRRR